MSFWLIEALSMVIGALLGLVPLLVGQHKGKPALGMFGWLCSIASGLVFLQIPVSVTFMILCFTLPHDFAPWLRRAPSPAPAPASAPAAPRSAALGITCLSGPFKGRTYVIGERGILIGREADCAICFDASTPGISRHHCSIRWQQGALMLTDLESAYGTFLSDGRKLPPQFPTQVGAGTRFYLGDRGNLFQIVITT